MSSVQTNFLARYKERSDSVLERLLSESWGSDNRGIDELHEAMRYALTNGGKRVRPTLSYATAAALDLPQDVVDVPAAAIEIVHAYSLVHDDLPAMDDDDLRRGLPTCHKKYGEATAILVGDALQALAFTVLAENPDTRLSASTKVNMITLLGHEMLSLSDLQRMHMHKTGRLIHASILMVALADPSCSPELQQRLSKFAEDIGLLFQIVDDILDVVSGRG